MPPSEPGITHSTCAARRLRISYVRTPAVSLPESHRGLDRPLLLAPSRGLGAASSHTLTPRSPASFSLKGKLPSRMPTSTLIASAAFTPANATQPSYSSPPSTLPVATTVTSYVATELTLEGLSANGNPSAAVLPIPAGWDSASQVVVQNVDTTNSCVILLNGESTITSALFGGNVVLAQTFQIVVNDQIVATYTAVAAAPTATQFVRGGTLAVSLSNLYTKIAANLPVGINAVTSNAADTLYFTSSLAVVISGTWTSMAETTATSDYVLLAPGQVFASSFAAATAATLASYTAMDPRLFTLISADSTGDTSADVTCAVYCYVAGA